MRQMDRRCFMKFASTILAASSLAVLTGCDGGGTTVPSLDGSVSLKSVKALNGKWTWNNIVPEDPFGNQYTKAVNYIVFMPHDDSMESSWVGYETRYTTEYRVYKQYKKLTMDLAPYKDMPKDGSAFVRVYADDELVATSPIVYQKTDKFKFEAEIEGAEYIKVEAVCSNGSSWLGCDGAKDGKLILANVKLWK